jgi:hypothetical protein
VGAPAKLTESDVKAIRRRVAKGEYQTDLAREFEVNRRTVRRRLDELDQAEKAEAERIAAVRLQRQAARERRKLTQREAALEPVQNRARVSRGTVRRRAPDAYLEWLDTPKNLSGRARAEAQGLVRVRRGDEGRWVEREEAARFLDVGWLLDD